MRQIKKHYRVILVVLMVIGLIAIPVYFYLINPPAVMCWDGVDERGDWYGGCGPNYSFTLFATILCSCIWMIVCSVCFAVMYFLNKKKQEK